MVSGDYSGVSRNMTTPLERTQSALDSLLLLETVLPTDPSKEIQEAVFTLRSLLETLQAPLLAQAAAPRSLASYKPGEYVEVLWLQSGTWENGFISSIDPLSKHLHVETEKGPVTIGTVRRVRPQSGV